MIVLTVIVEVSCAAINRKIMWFTTSVVTEPGAVLFTQRAQHREQVVARRTVPLGPLALQVPAEELLEQPSAGQRPSPAGAGDRYPHQRGRGLDAGDEGFVDLVQLTGVGEVGATHEHLGRQVERQLLQRRVDPKVGTGLPGVKARRNGRPEGRGITGEALARESLLHQPAVTVVLLEVEQHQAAVEERADQLPPTGPTGERLVGVLAARSRRRPDRGAPSSSHRGSQPRRPARTRRTGCSSSAADREHRRAWSR